MKDGYDVHGVDVTYNDFIIIGPSDDPAGISSGMILRRLSFVGLIALSSIVRNEVALRGNFETFNFESHS